MLDKVIYIFKSPEYFSENHTMKQTRLIHIIALFYMFEKHNEHKVKLFSVGILFIPTEY